MEPLIVFLGSIHNLSPGLTECLSRSLKVKKLKRKEFLLEAGQVCKKVCFVEKGLLRCFYEKGRSEISSWFMKEGDVIISIESFYEQQPSFEYIQALEETTLYYINYEELNYIYEKFPEFNFIGRILTERYYTLWARQLYVLRMHHGLDRYLWLREHHADLILRVPAKYIASYLGIDETSLSRIKNLNKRMIS